MKPETSQDSISIFVNKQQVMLHDHKTNGQAVKDAAVAQGVSIQASFALFRIAGHSQHQVRDDEDLTVHKDQHFRAVAADDNS